MLKGINMKSVIVPIVILNFIICQNLFSLDFLSNNDLETQIYQDGELLKTVPNKYSSRVINTSGIVFIDPCKSHFLFIAMVFLFLDSIF